MALHHPLEAGLLPPTPYTLLQATSAAATTHHGSQIQPREIHAWAKARIRALWFGVEFSHGVAQVGMGRRLGHGHFGNSCRPKVGGGELRAYPHCPHLLLLLLTLLLENSHQSSNLCRISSLLTDILREFPLVLQEMLLLLLLLLLRLLKK